MNALLRKHLWIVDLVGVAICAVFLGRAGASAFESSVLLELPVPTQPPRAIPTAVESGYPKAIDDVIRRNVFCSDCPPIITEEKEEGPAVVDMTPQPTSLPVELIAINYVQPPWGFQYSSGILRDTESKFVGAFHAGMQVKGATITGIDETRMHLDNAGKPEYVDLLKEEGATAAADPTPTPVVARAAPSNSASDAFTQELDRGIKKIGEHKYEIQRSTLESVLGNMSLLSRSARIVPEIRDGKAAGFRLYSVRPEGPFAKIGMQNGDVISAINGMEITSPEKALEVYAKLKSASHLSLGLERNGQRITKDYSIR